MSGTFVSAKGSGWTSLRTKGPRRRLGADTRTCTEDGASSSLNCLETVPSRQKAAPSRRELALTARAKHDLVQGRRVPPHQRKRKSLAGRGQPESCIIM